MWFCVRIFAIMPKKKTKEQVLKDFKKVHGDTYDYSLVNYVNTQTKVSIICKEHSIFEQTPNKHIMGRRCPKCFGHIKLTTEQFVEKANITHNNKYDYRLSIYKGNKNKLKIICPIHGVFEQTPIAHTKGQGCYYCGIEKVNNIKRFTIYEFIEKAKKVHGDKYDYSLVKYVNSLTKVKIICPKHGESNQTPNYHLNGYGCPKCGNEKTAISRRKKPTGWSQKDWIKTSETSKYFDSFKVYVIICWNGEEKFYKIGRTFKKTKIRFIPSKMPYNYEVLKEIVFDTAKEAFDKENELKRIHERYKYIPEIKFNGMYECFSKINLDI